MTFPFVLFCHYSEQFPVSQAEQFSDGLSGQKHEPMYKDERGIRLADVLCGEKFKYEYSFSDGLCFQVTVKEAFVQGATKQ